MKPRILIATRALYLLWPLTMIFLAACRTAPESVAPATTAAPSTALKSPALAPRSPVLIQNFGPMDDAYDGVTASEESVEVRAVTKTADGKTSVSESIGWKPRGNWFVFVENDSRVWIFDGGTKLSMWNYVKLSESKSGSTWHTASNLPCPIPDQIGKLLSNQVLQSIKIGL
jgi:hypothetical protein